MVLFNAVLSTDEVPPDLEECLRRAGIAPGNYRKHHAMDDAAAVRDLIEWNYSRKVRIYQS